MMPYFKDKGTKIARHDPSPHALGVSAYSKNQKEAFAYVRLVHQPGDRS